LRHAPLLIVYEMTLASKEHKELVSSTLSRVIQRPDENHRICGDLLEAGWREATARQSGKERFGAGL